MDLVKFTDKLGGKDPSAPPFRIPARDLDKNFAMLKPLKQDGNTRQYLLTETPEGWAIKIFPDFPSGSDTYVLGIQNGSMQWVNMGDLGEVGEDEELNIYRLLAAYRRWDQDIPMSDVIGLINALDSKIGDPGDADWLLVERCNGDTVRVLARGNWS